MTQNSSRTLTWATFAAGVASALLLVAIGCVKPTSQQHAGPGLLPQPLSAADPDAASRRFIGRPANTSLRIVRDPDLPPARR